MKSNAMTFEQFAQCFDSVDYINSESSFVGCTNFQRAIYNISQNLGSLEMTSDELCTKIQIIHPLVGELIKHAQEPLEQGLRQILGIDTLTFNLCVRYIDSIAEHDIQRIAAIIAYVIPKYDSLAELNKLAEKFTELVKHGVFNNYVKGC